MGATCPSPAAVGQARGSKARSLKWVRARAAKSGRPGWSGSKAVCSKACAHQDVTGMGEPASIGCTNTAAAWGTHHAHDRHSLSQCEPLLGVLVGGCAFLCPALYNVRRPGNYLAVHWQTPPVPVLAVVTPSALGSAVCGALPARGRERTRPGLGAREPAVTAWARTRLVRSLGPPSLYKLLPGQRHPLQSGPCTHADVAKCAVELERHEAFEARAQAAAAHTHFGHSLPHTKQKFTFWGFPGRWPRAAPSPRHPRV